MIVITFVNYLKKAWIFIDSFGKSYWKMHDKKEVWLYFSSFHSKNNIIFHFYKHELEPIKYGNFITLFNLFDLYIL